MVVWASGSLANRRRRLATTDTLTRQRQVNIACRNTVCASDSGGSTRHPHLRQRASHHFSNALPVQRLKLCQDAARLGAQPGDIDAHATWRGWFQVGEATAEFVHRAAPVAVPQVVAADADLEDALVEVADVVGLDAPDRLQRLVALPVLPGVELRDPLQQQGR